MAHGDYACCACCDDKCYYDSSAEPKDTLCTSCAVGLSRRLGTEVTTPAKLLEILRTWPDADDDQLLEALKANGFSKCCYWNDIDDAFTNRFPAEP
jgi:hypothetical protein